MKKGNLTHLIVMIAVHAVPFLLFLILPKFGISTQLVFAIFILTMVMAHFWMMKGHSHNYTKDKEKTKKEVCH